MHKPTVKNSCTEYCFELGVQGTRRSPMGQRYRIRQIGHTCFSYFTMFQDYVGLR